MALMDAMDPVEPALKGLRALIAFAFHAPLIAKEKRVEMMDAADHVGTAHSANLVKMANVHVLLIVKVNNADQMDVAERVGQIIVKPQTVLVAMDSVKSLCPIPVQAVRALGKRLIALMGNVYAIKTLAALDSNA